MSRFTLPRDVYHGKGCLAELKNLKGKKAILVVGGGSMKRQGFLDKAVSYLKENVKILFYYSPSDYAVVLNTQNGEEVYFYIPSSRMRNLFYNWTQKH